jgi:hypothetical protein
MLAWAPVIASRFLALLVLAAALLAVQGTFGGAPTVSDRMELPASSDGGDSDTDGDDVPFFVLTMSTVSEPARLGRSYFDTHLTPALPPALARIFRPPISPLA